MSDHLTNPYGEKGKLYEQTYSGMAAWAGTGPDGKTCRECGHYKTKGYYSVNGKHAGGLKPGKCSMYTRMMKAPGSSFPYQARACNRFEQASNPPAHSKYLVRS